jgi:hypothetical protein
MIKILEKAKLSAKSHLAELTPMTALSYVSVIQRMGNNLSQIIP